MCPAWKACIFVEVDDSFEEERNLIPSSYQILALLSFARGIIPNRLGLLDNSAKKTSMRFAFEVLASLRLALRTSLRSFSASLIKVDLLGIIPSKLSKIHIF